MLQIDNGRLFVDLGGLSIVSGALNSTNPDLVTKGALLLGSASQRYVLDLHVFVIRLRF